MLRQNGPFGDLARSVIDYVIYNVIYYRAGQITERAILS
jgi:hypothetical protein